MNLEKAACLPKLHVEIKVMIVRFFYFAPMFSCLNIHSHQNNGLAIVLRSKLHDLEEYFHGSLKSAYLFKQTGICYKGKNVSSVAFKFGHSKRPREGFDASVLIALY